MADEEVKGLREMLAEAATEAEPPAETPETPVAETAESQPAEDKASEGRARDANGRFLPKDGEGEAAEAAPETAASTETPPTETKEDAATTAAPSEAPAHWSQADKEWIAGLPAEHRASVVERFKQIEAGFTPKLQKLSQFEKEFGGAAEIFAPYMEHFRQRGQTPSDAIKVWATVEQTLLNSRSAAAQGRADPAGAQVVANIIKNYQIDPGEVARYLQGQAATAPQPGEGTGTPAQNGYVVDPALMQKVQTLEEKISQREQIEQATKINAAQAQIDRFVAEKNADGSLKHPFYSELEPVITDLARFERSQGRVPDLTALYDQAVWANGSTRERLLSAQRQAAEKTAAEERKAKAEAARKASSSVTGAPSPGQTTTRAPTTRSLRDDLLSAAEEATAR